MRPSALRLLSWLLSVLLLSGSVGASDFASDVRRLGSADFGEVKTAIENIGTSSEGGALRVLEALEARELKVDPAGGVFIENDDGVVDAASGQPSTPSGPLEARVMNNVLRRALGPALAQQRLNAGDVATRLAAATEMAKNPTEEARGLIESALKAQRTGDVHEQLSIALVKLDIGSTDVPRQLEAIRTIRRVGMLELEGELKGLVASAKDEQLQKAAHGALNALRGKLFWLNIVANLFYGLSLGSILLLAALGLAITFGLMRVINMAHGEMLMLGAYATFVVQGLFESHAPSAFGWYLVVAIPTAFGVCFLVGVALERGVIRFLYGRPLETLLATWGLSLMLIQTVRMIFGAQNVTVANPDWLSGGWQLAPTVVLPYSRIAVIVFTVVVVSFVWALLQKTRLGLDVRAVTQNRDMAASLGIPTRRVDMMTFGFGSGVAGLGGVALSQLGNVGPELGQQYIVDSFMVVVLGGVGNIIGSISGALGLGVLNKLIEPLSGAVLGKIIILGLLILFIQKRPQGIFAVKGRAAVGA